MKSTFKTHTHKKGKPTTTNNRKTAPNYKTDRSNAQSNSLGLYKVDVITEANFSLGWPLPGSPGMYSLL